jgi:hypothetical protein
MPQGAARPDSALPGSDHAVDGRVSVELTISRRSLTKTDLVEAAVACAPVWWSSADGSHDSLPRRH